jgi:hypothetical protein
VVHPYQFRLTPAQQALAAENRGLLALLAHDPLLAPMARALGREAAQDAGILGLLRAADYERRRAPFST